jgi:predicted nucleic acid-binding protein
LQSLYRNDPEVLTWWGSRVECVSAVARHERERALTASDVRASFVRLDGLASKWHEIEPTEPLRTLAQRLLRTHPLRSADALQLAAALSSVPGGEIVCLEERLAVAAEKEGLRVLPAGT